MRVFPHPVPKYAMIWGHSLEWNCGAGVEGEKKRRTGRVGEGVVFFLSGNPGVEYCQPWQLNPQLTLRSLDHSRTSSWYKRGANDAS
jgi:hypothetical protein